MSLLSCIPDNTTAHTSGPCFLLLHNTLCQTRLNLMSIAFVSRKKKRVKNDRKITRAHYFFNENEEKLLFCLRKLNNIKFAILELLQPKATNERPTSWCLCLYSPKSNSKGRCLVKVFSLFIFLGCGYQEIPFSSASAQWPTIRAETLYDNVAPIPYTFSFLSSSPPPSLKKARLQVLLAKRLKNDATHSRKL